MLGSQLLRVTALVALVFFLSHPGARAELRVDITQGTAEPLPIAVTDFFGAGGNDAQYGRDIATVISQNLERSGLFKPIDRRAFIQGDTSLSTLPRFGDWRIINAQALVQGRTQIVPDGRLRVEFRLWDVFAEQQMVGLAYFTIPENWRRVAHIISDQIYKRITGEEGYFDTRIVYIAESGPELRRIKRLAVMDQDGANHQFLTDGSTLVLTPRFSPTLQEITYLSFQNNKAHVYIKNIQDGREELLGSFPGMSFAPRFSPDGQSVIMSIADGGRSNIHVMDLRTRQSRQITSSNSINTSANFSPDSSEIVFESDRGGSQQIYVMNANGSNVRRISYGKGRYATPVWSPRGDLIAFTKITPGEYHIGVMRPDGSDERLLAKDFLVESPTWSPNGRVIMFTRQSRINGRATEPRLYSVDLTGFNEREIITPIGGSDPAWSPLIP